MKRNAFTIIFALFLIAYIVGVFSGCDGPKNDNVCEDNMYIEYEKGIFDQNDWNEEFGTYYGDVIPNEQVAINVAVQIYNGMPLSAEKKEYTPQFVFFDEQDAVWVVAFWKDWNEPDQITVGDECYIAMQRKDGKVLRIWWCE